MLNFGSVLLLIYRSFSRGVFFIVYYCLCLSVHRLIS